MAVVESQTRYDTVYVVPFDEKAYGGDPNGHREAGSSRARFYMIEDEEHGVFFRGAHDIQGQGRSTPRHRHTFEQIYCVLSGHEVLNGKERTGGTIAYHPESVYYGPQVTPPTGCEEVVCQFPAPSGKYFGSFEALNVAMKGLKGEKGVEFKDGMAVWPDGTIQDSVEAAWEYLTGGPLEYAPPRYDDPVTVHTQAMPWAPTAQPGIEAKYVGRFNECGPEVHLLKLAPGTSTEAGVAECAQMRFVLEGEATYAGQSLRRVSFLYYPPTVPYEAMTTEQGATVLLVQLQPNAGLLRPIPRF